MIPRLKSPRLALALLLWATLSCDRVTGLATTGGLRLRLVSEKPAGSVVAAAEQDGAGADLRPIDAPTLNVLLDSIRVTVSGPSTQTASATSGSGGSFNVTITGLAPGLYTVTVVGYSGGQVAHYGQTTATVTAGADTDAAVAFPSFQPVPPGAPTTVDTVEVLHFAISWPPVSNATSYIVEVGASPSLATFTTVPSSGTTIDIPVPVENQYYYAVRAVNAAAPTGGIRSAIRSVVVFQTVGSVTVTPPTPTVVDGATQQLTATARDLDNNAMPNVTLFWSSSNHSVATVDQAGLVTSVGSGQATIVAMAKGTPGSATVTVTQQAASKLVFTSPPTNTTGGQAIASIKVAIQNAKNEIRTSDNTTQVTLAIGANPGSGTLSGTAIATVVAGVATFNNLSINKSGTGYTLQATAASLTTGTSSGFNITAGAPTQLVFSTQPATTAAGDPISPALQVEIHDALGNRVTTARDAVTISIDNDPLGGTLSGANVVNAVDGIASFSGLSLDKAAPGYTLKATASGLSQGTTTAFTINPTTLAALAFGTQPVNSTTDNNVVVSVRGVDRFGNTVSQSVSIAVSIGTNPGGGTLAGTTTQPTSAGTATFNDLRIDRVGTGYTLSAQSGSLTAATSSAFDMTVGVPAKLAFTTPPDEESEPGGTMNTIEVSVQDAGGNQTAAAVSVSLALGSSPGFATLSGTLTSASANGIATFSDLAIDSTGAGYSLEATSSGLATAESTTFDVMLQFAQVQTGGLHTCGLTTQGSAYCWGWHQVGSVGDGTPGGLLSRNQPTRVAGTDRYFGISLGDAHACALRTTDSTAFCWGWNPDGQAGIGSTSTAITSPTAVLNGLKFVAISAGARHTCAITAVDSLAYCWGQQGLGRLGNNQTGTLAVTAPAAVNTADKFSSISAGAEHTCAVRNDGAGFCWGRQLNGRLGNGQVLEASVGNPVPIVGMTFLQISAGQQHSCGVVAPATDRRGYCWGNNANGQLGFTGVETGTPTEIAKSLKYTSIQAGGLATAQFSCGLTVGSTVFCWGSAVEGRLGNGVNTGTFDSPQPLISPLQFLSVDAATAGAVGISGPDQSKHGCGVTTAGVYCWGGNLAIGTVGGMLGDGTTLSSSVPVKVKGQR